MSLDSVAEEMEYAICEDGYFYLRSSWLSYCAKSEYIGLSHYVDTKRLA